MPATKQKDVLDACRKIVQAQGKWAYHDQARAYAQAALDNPYGGGAMDGHELRVQVLYILNNISHWRGPEAKEVRAILKAYAN